MLVVEPILPENVFNPIASFQSQSPLLLFYITLFSLLLFLFTSYYNHSFIIVILAIDRVDYFQHRLGVIHNCEYIYVRDKLRVYLYTWQRGCVG